jgi:hypothetical protein
MLVNNDGQGKASETTANGVVHLQFPLFCQLCADDSARICNAEDLLQHLRLKHRTRREDDSFVCRCV